MKVNMRASAVLVWLPEGETPAIDSFDPRNVQPPPTPNPEPWWFLEEAVIYAREVERRGHEKVPWIKTGDTLLSPDQIIQAYSGLRAMKAFDAPRS
jgi:hypothetical protein